MASNSSGMAGNPFFMIVGLGIGAAALIAVAIAATAPVTDDAVGPGPDVEVADEGQTPPENETAAQGETATEEAEANASAEEEVAAQEETEVSGQTGDSAGTTTEGEPTAAPADGEGQSGEGGEATASEGGDGAAAPEQSGEGGAEGAISTNAGAAGNEAPTVDAGDPQAPDDAPLDTSQAEAEASDGDGIGDAAPDPATANVEESGDAVTPEDTESTVTPVDNPDVQAPAAGDALIPDANEGEASGDAAAEGSGNDTDLAVDEQVVDPDNGAKGGPDPDGGAEPFFPTPSGPEGSDGNPLTTD